ncbi:MAG: type II site-specific deoxyribonuclease, partial [Chloroflexota bacterium]|nr:type II site-specific deoxyribonuclease [Chloroflexota bacterium]
VNSALNKNAGVTTHHHLNKDILRKYRGVTAWYVAIYEGVKLHQIYKIVPAKLEPLFAKWEKRLDEGLPHINNPKIPLKLLRAEGELVYHTG